MVTQIKFDYESFERWRKSRPFPDEKTANLAMVIGKNLKDPSWKQSPSATKFMCGLVEELISATAKS